MSLYFVAKNILSINEIHTLTGAAGIHRKMVKTNMQIHDNISISNLWNSFTQSNHKTKIDFKFFFLVVHSLRITLFALKIVNTIYTSSRQRKKQVFRNTQKIKTKMQFSWPISGVLLHAPN